MHTIISTEAEQATRVLDTLLTAWTRTDRDQHTEWTLTTDAGDWCVSVDRYEVAVYTPISPGFVADVLPITASVPSRRDVAAMLVAEGCPAVTA